MVNGNGYFKGKTDQSITDLGKSIDELKNEIGGMRKWLFSVTIITFVAVVERLPDFIKYISALPVNAGR